MNQLDYKENGIGYVRYFAAISVMTLHFASLYMKYCNDSNDLLADLFRGIAVSVPGVVIFFAISGYLAMASLEKKTFREYCVNKITRIYPEYWLCTIINIVVILWLASNMLDSSFAVWIVTQFFGVANTPDCLKGFATGSVNGPLWTVFVQMQIFILLGIMSKLLRRISVFKWGMLILASIAMNGLCRFISDKYTAGIVPKLIERTFFPYFFWALIGALIFRYKEYIIPVLKKIWWVVLIVLLGIGYLTYYAPGVLNYGYYSGIITGILTPLFALGLSYALPSKRVKDISYSIFLYQWIVMNVIIYFDLFNKWNVLICLLSFVIGTLILSIISSMIIGRINIIINIKRRMGHG